MLEDGALHQGPQRSRAGDAIWLRAEMDLAIGLSACPSLGCNGGTPLPLAYEILDRDGVSLVTYPEATKLPEPADS